MRSFPSSSAKMRPSSHPFSTSISVPSELGCTLKLHTPPPGSPRTPHSRVGRARPPHRSAAPASAPAPPSASRRRAAAPRRRAPGREAAAAARHGAGAAGPGREGAGWAAPWPRPGPAARRAVQDPWLAAVREAVAARPRRYKRRQRAGRGQGAG